MRAVPCDHCPCPGTCLRWAAFCEWAAEDPPDEVKLAHIRNRSAMGRTPEYPPLAWTAANLGRALWDWAVSGFSMASEEEVSRRLSLCESCEFFDAGPRRCKHLGCGCFLDQKVRMKTEHCPVGRW